jgi:hypothetical protein
VSNFVQTKLGQNQFLATIAAHRMYVGPLSQNQVHKIIDWIKVSGKFSVKRLLKELGGEAKGNALGISDFDMMLIRAARIIQKI